MPRLTCIESHHGFKPFSCSYLAMQILQDSSAACNLLVFLYSLAAINTSSLQQPCLCCCRCQHSIHPFDQRPLSCSPSHRTLLGLTCCRSTLPAPSSLLSLVLSPVLSLVLSLPLQQQCCFSKGRCHSKTWYACSTLFGLAMTLHYCLSGFKCSCHNMCC